MCVDLNAYIAEFQFSLLYIYIYKKKKDMEGLPTSDISGTFAENGPSGNVGALSLTSWTLMMNSDSASREWFVCQSMALAWRTYCDFLSRSRLLAAWMSPDVSSIMKIEPAPSPDRMYLTEPSPLSELEWSWRCKREKTEKEESSVIAWHQDEWPANGEEQVMSRAIKLGKEKYKKLTGSKKCLISAIRYCHGT